MVTRGGEGGSGPMLGGACRRRGSRAGSDVVEVGAVGRRARQGSGEEKGVQACGPLWAGWRGQPEMNNDAL
jgi:hypothetical protein